MGFIGIYEVFIGAYDLEMSVSCFWVTSKYGKLITVT
jgi:hypothetical protein